jgi:hypothetical protein
VNRAPEAAPSARIRSATGWAARAGGGEVRPARQQVQGRDQGHQGRARRSTARASWACSRWWRRSGWRS